MAGLTNAEASRFSRRVAVRTSAAWAYFTVRLFSNRTLAAKRRRVKCAGSTSPCSRAGGELSIAGSTFCDNEPADLDSPAGWTDLGGNAFDAEGCARMAGDLDGDGCITGADFGLLLQQWSVTSGSPADLNRDGVVDGGDIGVLFTNWGQCF